MTPSVNTESESMVFLTRFIKKNCYSVKSASFHLLKKVFFLSISTKNMIFLSPSRVMSATYVITLVNQIPKLLYEKITSGRTYNTRGTTHQHVERTHVEEARLKLASSSFRWRGHIQHSSIPSSLQDERDMNVFKSKLKGWVQENVPI